MTTIRAEKGSALTRSEVDANFLEVRASKNTLQSATEAFYFTTDTAYGAVGDNSNDDTEAFQAAIDACGAAGGGVVVFPPNRCKITDTLIVSDPNVFLMGSGGDIRHTNSPFGGMNNGTILDWAGAAGGTMVRFSSGNNFTNKASGGGLSGMTFDAQATADFCLDVTSWNNGRFTDFMCLDADDSGLLMDVVASTSGDVRDPQNNFFASFYIQAPTSTKGILLRASTAGANPSYNYFENYFIIGADGIGVDLYDCDNNFFKHGRILMTGTGSAVVFNGSNENIEYVPRDNVFWHLTTDQAIIVRGTSSFTHPAQRNACFLLDQTNSTVAPTVEAGARMSYSFIDGNQYLFQGVNGISADTEQRASAGYDTHISTSKVFSHIFVNNSDAHIRLQNTDASKAWNIVVSNTTSDLQFNQAAGSGVVRFGTHSAIAAETVTGYITMKDSAGNTRKLAVVS